MSRENAVHLVVDETPMRVGTVRVVRVGPRKVTQAAVIEREVALSGVRDASTFGEVQTRVASLLGGLIDLNVFKGSQVLLDVGRGPAQLDVEVVLEEAGRLYVEQSTSVGNSEGSVSLGAKLRNIGGQATTINVDGSMSNKNALSVQASVRQPRFLDGKWPTVEAGVAKQLFIFDDTSSYQEDSKSVFAKVLKDGHEFGWSGTWRDVLARPSASLAVREDAGASLKSAIFHNYTYENVGESELNHVAPGYTASARTELAGLGGNVRFLKTQVEVARHAVVNNFFGLHLSAKCGFLASFGGDRTRVNDRLHANMRGFAPRSIGPYDAQARDAQSLAGTGGSDTLGGDLTANVTARLSFDLPSRLLTSVGVHGHVFADAGNVVRLHGTRPSAETLRGMARTARVSLGAGLVIPAGMGEIEINGCIAALASPRDRRRSFQLSVGGYVL